MRDTPREQLRFGLRLFGGFVGAAIVLGWLMYPLPLTTPLIDSFPR